MKQITLNRYSFKELDDKAKDKAINEHIDFLIETVNVEELDKEDGLYKAIKEAEDMRTPWFVGAYIWDYCKEDILKELEEMGEVFNIKGEYGSNI